MYIWFNNELFNTEAEKILFTAAYLYSDALNWFKLTLNNYLTCERSQCEDMTNEIFISYQTFKKKIKIVFRIINKEYTAEQEISLL